MKKHKENTNKKNKKVAAGAALGVAAAAGVAAMASGKDAEADAANDENAADSPAESRLEEAAESAAGQMADDVANVEQVTPDGDNESDVLAANDDAVIDDDVIIVENSTEPFSDDVEVLVVESTPEPVAVESTATETAHVEPIHAEPAHVEPAHAEPVAVEPTVTEPVVTEPVAQNEPAVEDVQMVNNNLQDNDVAVLENDPMYHPGTIDDGDFYDPDVNAVDYMAEGEGIPDELMDNDGIGDIVAGLADGIVEGIKDLGNSIADVFSGDAKDDFMNGDSSGIDEDGSPDYINDANVDAFQ